MKRVVMDTNFIIEVAKNKINLERELKRIVDFPYKLFMVEGSREELGRIINEQRGRERETAKLALDLTKDVKTIHAEGRSVDEKLTRIADKDTIIATQDRELKKKIKGQVIVVRQNKYLKLI